jgi:hypothetical protein
MMMMTMMTMIKIKEMCRAGHVSPTTQMHGLDTVKYRCLIPFSVAKQVAMTLDLELDRYMYAY